MYSAANPLPQSTIVYNFSFSQYLQVRPFYAFCLCLKDILFRSMASSTQATLKNLTIFLKIEK